LDVAGSAADHALGLGPHRQGPAVLDVDGDDRRLVQHDAATAHVDEGVGRPQIDGHVPAHQGREEVVRHAKEPPDPGGGLRQATGGLLSPPAEGSLQAKWGKKRPISRVADSGPSLPWTRFSVTMRPKSPRMVPGAASLGSVTPIIV